MARNRRGFKVNLQQLREARAELRNEFRGVKVDPGFQVDQQGFVPYNWYRTRRHVRHLYWQNYYQQAPVVKTGEGSAGQTE